MLAKLGALVERSTRDVHPWTNVVGAARTLIAVSTALTLAFNDAAVLFPVVPRSMMPPPYCTGVRQVAAFCLAPATALDPVRWACIAALLVVASGYRPRVTGLVHAWISFSLAVSSPLLDGGDQVASILTLLLLPIALTDPRRWHWASFADEAQPGPTVRMLVWMTLLLIRLQVAGIYFHAAVGKAAVEDWANGTALFYWLRHPIVGATGLSGRVFLALTSYAAPVAVLTWGVMALEFMLAAGLFVSRRGRRALLVSGVLLHLGIMMLHGLVSFSMIMIAALVLFLRPTGDAFSFGAVRLLPSGPRASVPPTARAREA